MPEQNNPDVNQAPDTVSRPDGQKGIESPLPGQTPAEAPPNEIPYEDDTPKTIPSKAGA